MSDECKSRQQLHIFQNYTFTADTIKYIQITSMFPVKEVKFNFAYSVSSAVGIPLVAITSSLVQNETVGVLANYGYYDATPTYNIRDTFKVSTTYSHIFRDPQVFNGQYTLNISNLIPANVINSGQLLAHVELLS